MTRTRWQSSLVLILAFLVSSAVAQVATGTPPFSSLKGGPDVVNLGNLNVHMAYPVLHKAGRGLPLSFDFTNDSSFWYPVASNGATVWNPVQTGGWSGSPQGVGNLGYAYITDGVTFIRYFFVYYDSTGTRHPFPGEADWYSCTYYGSGCGDYTLIGSTATDSSGYTLSADPCYPNIQNGNLAQCPLVYGITSADGSSIVPQNGIPLNPTVTAGSVVDRNGNEITTDSSGNVLDTLGLQNGLQTLRASGGLPNPYVLTYTSPAGTSASVTSTPKSYQVRTNFGCAGIGEYGGTGGLTASLVDKITLPDGTFYHFTYEVTPGDTHNPHNVTGRVASITLPTGGTISYNYTGANHGIECTDGSTSGLTRTTPDGAWTYSRVLGTGAASTTTAIDPKGNRTVIQFQGIYETKRQTYQGAIQASNLLQTIDTCYNGASAPCTATAITLPVFSRTETTQLGTFATGVHSKKVFTYDKELINGVYSSYGLTTEEDDYDWGASAPGALLKKTIITYNTSLGPTQDLPTSVTIQDGSGATVSSVALTYDEGTPTATSGTPEHATLPPGAPRGNLTTLAVSANASTTIYRKFTYYDTGNPNTSTAVSTSSTSPGATTTYNYAAGAASCGNSFATSVSEPLGLSHSMTWNCVGGVELQATDENSAITSSTYTDPYFWRPSETTDAYPSNTFLTYTGANIAESTLTFNSGASTVDLLVTADGLGRPQLTQKKQSPTATNYDTTETDYDIAGLPFKKSLPFSDPAGQTNTGAVGTTTTYDALNRPLQTSDSGGGYTSYSYIKNDVLVTVGPQVTIPATENLKRRQLEYDALGRLTSVCELTSTANGGGTCSQSTPQTGYWTKYTYDANGNQTGVTQNAQATSGQQSRAYVYDRLSRVTSETNPESGTKTYTYDADATCGSSTSQAGQLVKRVDAMNNVTCYNYDALNRNTSITYPSGPYAAVTPTKTFVYDATTFSCPGGVANVKTRLAEAYTGPSSSKITDLAYCYTPRGEIAEVFESTPNSGGAYQVPMTYWENGLLKTFGPFVSMEEQSQTPDGEGRVGLVQNLHNGYWYNEASGITYNAASQPTQMMTSCAGATCYPINYTYDPNTLRMTQYAAALSTGTVSGTLTWNPNASLQKLVIVDPGNSADSQTCQYSADDLGRISSANCGSTWAQTFTYDPFSNISKSGSISWLPGYSSNTNRYTLGGTSYDANGNVLNDTADAYTWDAEGKRLSSASGAYTYVYDAFGHKVEWSATSKGTTYYEDSYLYIGKMKLSAHAQTEDYSEFPLPGGSVLSFGGGATVVQLADWLGTIRAWYSYTGGSESRSSAHAPFGESYAYAGGYPIGFTGQLPDGNMTNTTYGFPERLYRSNQGRWLTPDPAGMGVVDPADPQTWNRYAYVRNSPLNRVDPQGLDDWDEGWGGDGGGWGDGGWGGDGGGWGGTLTIIIGNGGVGVGFNGFSGGCSGESLGMPCGMSITDPKAALARQMIIAAIKGDWKTALGLGLAPLEGELWNQALNPIYDFSGTGTIALPKPWVAPWWEVLEGGMWTLLLMQQSDAAPPQQSRNFSENRKFEWAWQEIQRRCGPLDKGQRRRLHDEITGQGYDIRTIIEIGVGMFCPGK
jgi:RHS repeat-associated protein